MSTKNIVLKAPHRHAGRDYPVGAKLTLAADKADWLISIDRATEAPAPEPAAENAAKKPKA